jgi:DNA topoisomerase II
MSHAAKEVIEKNPRNQDYTMVEFYPDLAKFQMENLDDDTVALMCRRAFDLAGTVRGVKVRLNDDLIPVRLTRNFFLDFFLTLIGCI